MHSTMLTQASVDSYNLLNKSASNLQRNYITTQCPAVHVHAAVE